MAPRDQTASNDIYAAVQTPIGPLQVAFNAEGIAMAVPGADGQELERAFEAFFKRTPRPVAESTSALASAVVGHIDGTAPPTALRFDLRRFTPFDRAVLLKLLEIPRGEVRSYAWMAREIGHPRATRAVGSANARNPVAVLIPCHRLIRGDGAIHKYGHGPDMKRALLRYEGADLDQIDRFRRQGIRFVGNDHSRLFCFPSCRQARQIPEADQEYFASARHATEAGYRPCNVCRPVT